MSISCVREPPHSAVDQPAFARRTKTFRVLAELLAFGFAELVISPPNARSRRHRSTTRAPSAFTSRDLDESGQRDATLLEGAESLYYGFRSPEGLGLDRCYRLASILELVTDAPRY